MQSRRIIDNGFTDYDLVKHLPIPAVIIALGPLDDEKVACGFSALRLGFPIVTDQDVPEIAQTDFTLYEALVREKDYKKFVSRAVEIRGIKATLLDIPIPVPYSAAFEGERVRKNQMYAEFGGKLSVGCEYLKSVGLDAIEDGKIEVIGPEIDELEKGKSYPIGIYLEVAGRKMQKDFDPILERQIHTFLNEALGVFHVGQRNNCWIRISKDSKDKGFKIKHL